MTEFEFDEGKKDNIVDLDLSSARRINQEQKHINVDFPTWVVESLDRELLVSVLRGNP